MWCYLIVAAQVNSMFVKETTGLQSLDTNNVLIQCGKMEIDESIRKVYYTNDPKRILQICNYFMNDKSHYVENFKEKTFAVAIDTNIPYDPFVTHSNGTCQVAFPQIMDDLKKEIFRIPKECNHETLQFLKENGINNFGVILQNETYDGPLPVLDEKEEGAGKRQFRMYWDAIHHLSFDLDNDDLIKWVTKLMFIEESGRSPKTGCFFCPTCKTHFTYELKKLNEEELSNNVLAFWEMHNRAATEIVLNNPERALCLFPNYARCPYCRTSEGWNHVNIQRYLYMYYGHEDTSKCIYQSEEGDCEGHEQCEWNKYWKVCQKKKGNEKKGLKRFPL